MKIAIFDFYHTLSPTTHQATNPDSDLTKLAESMCNLLQFAYYYCDKVFIVTNAVREWVKQAFSSLPECDVLFELINIVPTDELGLRHNIPYRTIKTKAFFNILEPFFKESNRCEVPHHLLCFGDAPGDFLAGQTI